MIKVQKTQQYRGAVLIFAMLGVLGAGIVFGLAVDARKRVDEQRRRTTVTNYINQVQSALNLYLQDKAFYEPSAGRFRPNQAFFSSFNLTVPGRGASCPANLCSVRVELDPAAYWDSSSSKFTARIRYTGDDVNVAPLEFNFIVPKELTNASQYFTCDVSQPLFSGFDPQTSLPRCNPLPNPSSCPNVGEFVHSVSPSLRVVCGSFAQNINHCNTSSFLSSMPSWDPNQLSNGWSLPPCQSRLDPYSDPTYIPN